MITTAFGLKDRIVIVDKRFHLGESKENRWRKKTKQRGDGLTHQAGLSTQKLYLRAIISKTIH